MKKLRVTIDGKVYDVLVETLDDDANVAPRPVPFTPAQPPASVATTSAPITAPAPASIPAVAPTGSGTNVPSPLSGKVVSLDVKVGQVVEEGAQVATVEAMKMNTYVFAPKSGRVDALLVSPGDGVEEGAALIRIT